MSAQNDPASNQLELFYEEHKNLGTLTSGSGIPVGWMNAAETIGEDGEVVMQDVQFFDRLQHFVRERIPERVVHAKGAAAFGYFECTQDVTKYTAAKPFAKVGKRTPIAIRFSTVTRNIGSGDTIRNPRGFAVKFYTEEGNWDIVGNNTPIFFIRDSINFPQFVHSQKRNPATFLEDLNMLWDFASQRQEGIHQYLFMYSDRGIPASYRNMDGFGANTYSLINDESKRVYCKFHFKTNQGIKNFTQEEADRLSGTEPDYCIKELYNAIATGNPPSWTFYIQVMTHEQATKSKFNPFDVTVTWPHSEYPLIECGRLVLNRNQTNYFAEVEQLAFAPSNLIPGIGVSPDRLLQGRIFSYHDANIARLGVNFNQIPVNAPFRAANTERDGKACINNQGGAPNYYPNSFGSPADDLRSRKLQPPVPIHGKEILHYDTGSKDDNKEMFKQAGIFYRNVLNEDERQRLVKNLQNDLRKASPTIQDKMIKIFTKADASLGQALAGNKLVDV